MVTSGRSVPTGNSASVLAPSAGCSRASVAAPAPGAGAPLDSQRALLDHSGPDRQLLADIWEPTAGVERTGMAIVNLYGG